MAGDAPGGAVTIRECAGSSEYASLAAIWRSAVDATHDFLDPRDRDAIEARLIPSYFPNVALRVAEVDGGAGGFVGVADGKIEMLFVGAELRGRGVGSALLADALANGARQVDVNEQNTQAVGFYESRGFAVVDRSGLDDAGRPYPILHMTYGAAR
ncbi:putative acetyltransferase [Nocardiopsis mwathae]|uniref:Putative acetyltransferase n=1 Tax=Nocardiopsis mwathae TaxID=1472723 RepID=A0A7W9YJR0_9ACTN|nr:GNAT family N-acetyltransferase [Nocardiopsis mwathae]MBB6173428.1 putative acetyltransferase [Nocardiopsis mwathae]